MARAPSSVGEIRAALAHASDVELPALIDRHEPDTRSGVRQAVEAARRRLDRHNAESERLDRLHSLEERLREDGWSYIAGLDEVGRGALAGPVTAAAVVLPPGARIAGLNDSKQLAPHRREELAVVIGAVAVTCAVAHVPAHVTDALGMTRTVHRAMELALCRLAPSADHAITDGLRVGLAIPETPVVKGDSSVAAVAAASVLAKVARDHLMREIAPHYPDYAFEVNKGYGTPEHLEAIAVHGVCPLHRRSFGPCGGTPTLF
ncbi:MAG: ribonuclease HII [Anaerosomatales bacterium]|nr:ribonuclease HII [Anaerosomatales bacterium]MDT8433399.1 ribonuclease HII [Anaerosomatales bacterium]